MTRVFDQETGVVTPVTVIEAAPCPVVQVKTADADGYDAVQIAYEEVAERKVTKAELGHLKKNNVQGAYRHLLERCPVHHEADHDEDQAPHLHEPHGRPGALAHHAYRVRVAQEAVLRL